MLREGPLFLGIDFGTSGARAIVINSDQRIQSQHTAPLSQPDRPVLWQSTLFELISQIPLELRQRMRSIAVNGTSSTVFCCDAVGQPCSDVLMYNDNRAAAHIAQLPTIVPSHHPVRSATSSLVKLFWLQQQATANRAKYFVHQADWIAALLHGRLGVSDYHNALKLGYDVGDLAYPDWFEHWPEIIALLPQVLVPGMIVGPILPALTQAWGFPSNCVVCAGTTDSIAAFLASGVTQPGQAVTSLGSTLVVKLLSQLRIDDSRYGIYSHRLGDLWLVGGASNTGGAVLRAFFSPDELTELSKQIDPNRLTALDYYPLIQPGDRFPINDPALPPRLEPRPASPVQFLQGMLEGMARIEAKGFRLLQQLGATPLQSVKTAGGGAHNSAWMALRQQQLQVPVDVAEQVEAAYGSALLAKVGSQR